MQPPSETLNAAASLPPLQPLAEGFEQAHEFSTFANWIVPGHVMLGTCPYVEPSRCGTHEQGEEQLAQILNAGITTFICLQAEISPQQEMSTGGIESFVPPYADTASLLASAMGAPPGMQVVRLQFWHQPIPDFGIPTTKQVQSTTMEIRRRVKAGEKIYMHCGGGQGRAGTLGACLLGDLYPIGAEEALLRVQKAFDTRGGGADCQSPEMPEQIEFVKIYLSKAGMATRNPKPVATSLK